MISMDGYLAHINIAIYDRQYLDFLSGSSPRTDNDGFMKMSEYGPFDLRQWLPRGMGLFLEYVGALMLDTQG